ncbi:hypothetical protein C2S53_015791 [Perilla frutescens var. hirtella]|uniref:Uncharacterized protein n=1 Tax=Perilla frutescens var. hirtella TaxID=608512 RepID=A0AAD4J6J7_PERFH|nr:hypothetical protein C2S53_015791 [Perilla frutescens var. hirtella]
MNSSSSSSVKSEARSPFIRAPVEQMNVDRRLKRKLDFDPDPYLNGPLMEIGCSIPGPSMKRISRHLIDETITQPLDDLTKPTEAVDLIGRSDEVKDSCAGSHDAPKLFFPRNLYPSRDMIRSQPTANIPGASSHTLEEPSFNIKVINQALQMTRICPPMESADEHAFEDWYNSPDPLKKVMRIPVPTMEVQGVARDWFRSILDRHELISDQHIDSILHLFIIERKRHGVWLEKWTIMDMVCWQALTQPNYEYVRELVTPYVLDDCPATVGGVSSLYDPKSFMLKFDDYIPVFECMSCHIPKLLHDAKIVFHHDGKVLPHCPKWEITRFYNTPQQKLKQDCAIMALKYLTCLMNKEDINTVDPNACDARRLSYCSALYKFGMNLLRDGRGLNV